jgi:hypothetical protein
VNTREIVERLRAYHAGRPLPRGETLRVHVADDSNLLVVAFLRIGGESRPWALAYGHPNSTPSILSVPEGRDRDVVARMTFSFAPVLLEHLRTPGFGPASPVSEEELKPLRQIWLPNPSHLDMLHHLAFAYTYTRWGEEMRDTLNTFGRACQWLFAEAQRPGQQHVVLATDALRAAYTFPAEDVRQGHLGYLLRWLGEGSLDERLDGAIAAERESIATTLDPATERDKLERALTRWTEARRGDDERAMTEAAQLIAPVLGAELRRRFELTVQAVETLRNDGRRENRGLSVLVDAAADEQWNNHTNVERGFRDEPGGVRRFVALETDRFPAQAAHRYLVHEASAARATAELLHDDRELLAEVLGSGEAFRGTITDAHDEGSGRTTIPVWRVHQPFAVPMRLRGGSHVCLLGHPQRTAVVREVRDADGGGYDFVVEITNRKRAVKGATGQDAIPPADSRWQGIDVVFVQTSAADLATRKSFRVFKKDGPGAWLTHATPGGVLSRRQPEERRGAEAAA